MRLASVILALLTFTGCTLIDQRTFAPSPEAKAQTPAEQPKVPVDPRTALVTIDYTVASPDYAELLHYAVHAAEARDADVQYDVISVLKDTSDVAAGQERATGVMRAIMRDQVPAERIHLALRTDPSLTANQVRVYVR
jgi:glucose/arabinose dehydrogenase